MKRRWWAIAGLGATLIVPLLLLELLPQAEFSQSVCPQKLLTGLPCPGCGITRSIMSLYRGDLAGSFAYHAFGPAVVVVCVLGIAALLFEIRSRREVLRPFLYRRSLAYAAGTVLVGYHLVRLWQFVATHDLNGILHESIWR